jgi:hypothetical protein
MNCLHLSFQLSQLAALLMTLLMVPLFRAAVALIYWGTMFKSVLRQDNQTQIGSPRSELISNPKSQ